MPKRNPTCCSDYTDPTEGGSFPGAGGSTGGDSSGCSCGQVLSAALANVTEADGLIGWPAHRKYVVSLPFDKALSGFGLASSGETEIVLTYDSGKWVSEAFSLLCGVDEDHPYHLELKLFSTTKGGKSQQGATLKLVADESGCDFTFFAYCEHFDKLARSTFLVNRDEVNCLQFTECMVCVVPRASAFEDAGDPSACPCPLPKWMKVTFSGFEPLPSYSPSLCTPGGADETWLCAGLTPSYQAAFNGAFNRPHYVPYHPPSTCTVWRGVFPQVPEDGTWGYPIVNGTHITTPPTMLPHTADLEINIGIDAGAGTLTLLATWIATFPVDGSFNDLSFQVFHERDGADCFDFSSPIELDLSDASNLVGRVNEFTDFNSPLLDAFPGASILIEFLDLPPEIDTDDIDGDGVPEVHQCEGDKVPGGGYDGDEDGTPDPYCTWVWSTGGSWVWLGGANCPGISTWQGHCAMPEEDGDYVNDLRTTPCTP